MSHAPKLRWSPGSWLGQSEVPLDHFSYSACISASRGHWVVALTLLTAMKRQLRANEVTYNAAISAIGSGGRRGDH